MSCPDPETASRHVKMPPRWSDLRDLIDELMQTKSLSLGFHTSMAQSSDGRRSFRIDGLLYDRILASDERPEALAFNFQSARGDLEASEAWAGSDRVEEAGEFLASELEAVHHVRSGPMPPPIVLKVGRGQSSEEFRKIQDEISKVYRLVAEVLPEIDPQFRSRYSSVLTQVKREMDSHWVHHPTVRADVWAVPVGSLKQIPGLSSTVTFDMTQEKMRRLRERIGSGTTDLPVLLFHVGQPTQLEQRSDALTDAGVLQRLVLQLREIERRNASLGFVVRGYADGSGSPEGNRKLAQLRADWIVRRLKQDYGLQQAMQPVGCDDHNARMRSGSKINAKQRDVLFAPN